MRGASRGLALAGRGVAFDLAAVFSSGFLSEILSFLGLSWLKVPLLLDGLVAAFSSTCCSPSRLANRAAVSALACPRVES